MSLTEKVALVSGGSRGIGRAITLELAQKGANVAFLYYSNEQAASDVVKAANGYSGSVLAIKADIQKEAEVKRAVSETIAKHHKIDILVNNAGIRLDKTLAFMKEEEWLSVMNTNTLGMFYLTQTVIFHMLKKKRGRIVNISSVSGIDGIAGQTNYSGSKAAIIGVTKALAKEVAEYGIRVNAVAPGGVETDMVNDMKSNEKDKLLSGVPMRRFCRPEEVARVVAFLCDEGGAPDYMTGSVLVLDGGMGH